MSYPQHLKKLIYQLRRLPGVGMRSAERFAFDILSWTPAQQAEISQVIQNIQQEIRFCQDCGALADKMGCSLCAGSRLQESSLCVMAYPKDIYAMESTGEFRGLYHVLNGLLSPIDGIGPEKLALQKLVNRIERYSIHEVIVALDSTLEGDTTALYIKEKLSQLPVKLSRLAFGLPMGSTLDYVDPGTLARAFSCRAAF